MSKNILVLAIIASLACSAYSSCTGGVASTQGAVTVNTSCASTCFAGYYLSTTPSAGGGCYLCSSGYTTTTGNTAATCSTSCTAGTYCDYTLNAPTGSADAITSCPAGFYCPTGSVDPTPCATGQYSAVSATAASACASITGTAIAGCSTYTSAAAASCAYAASGYVTIAYGTPVASPITQCLANCTTCTASTYASCTVPAAGYFLNATTSTITSCATGCNSCSTASTCTAVSAGYSLVSGAPAACAAGTGNAVGATTSTCVACSSTSFCGNCLAPTFCTTCLPGYTLNATTGVCTAFTGTVDPTCAKAAGSTPSQCQTCNSSQFRSIAVNSSGTALPVGNCVCMSGYGDLTALGSANSNFSATCSACGTGAAGCTFNSVGALATITCASGNLAAGLMCSTPSAPPTGFFLNSASTAFAACATNCATCTSAASTACVTCLPKNSATYTPPTSNNSTYAQAFAGYTRVQINGTCYDSCPTGFVANSAMTSCVVAPAAGTASGVFAIFALVASLFLIF